MRWQREPPGAHCWRLERTNGVSHASQVAVGPESQLDTCPSSVDGTHRRVGCGEAMSHSRGRAWHLSSHPYVAPPGGQAPCWALGMQSLINRA